MHNFEANYTKILKVLHQIESRDNFLHQIRKPKLSDRELIALNLTAEYMGIDSECHLFRLLPTKLSNKIERSVYNRRRRKLFGFQEQIRQKIVTIFSEFEDCFIVDSMPLEICKLSRSSRSTICKEENVSSPSKGYCSAQKMYYYGYKLHLVCAVTGVITSLDISPAAVHDIHYLKDIKEQMSHCTLIGDKGYLSSEQQLNLFTTKKIKLEVPKRVNQAGYKKQAFVFRKSRKRIETLFSQLCDQFMVRRNYAKSFDGFRTRILSKISALTIVQYINKFIFNRNINNLKINIA